MGGHHRRSSETASVASGSSRSSRSSYSSGAGSSRSYGCSNSGSSGRSRRSSGGHSSSSRRSHTSQESGCNSVSRHISKTDNPAIRFMAHILRGPFAAAPEFKGRGGRKGSRYSGSRHSSSGDDSDDSESESESDDDSSQGSSPSPFAHHPGGPAGPVGGGGNGGPFGSAGFVQLNNGGGSPGGRPAYGVPVPGPLPPTVNRPQIDPMWGIPPRGQRWQQPTVELVNE